MAKLNTKVKALVITPGSGEFVYDTQVVTGCEGKLLNSNLVSGQSDAAVTLGSLLTKFPNLTKVAVVVGWFADSTNAGTLTIAPRVEYTIPFDNDPWVVGSYTRDNTQATTQWGGTPSDSSVIHLLSALKQLGLEVTLYPALYIDDGQKSWRGNITASSSADLDNFFTQYSNFITSCANMQHGGVTAKSLISNIIIGSELQKLLKYDDGSRTFPAVQKMQDINTQVKNIVGNNVSTIYEANWTEYGKDPTTKYYYLDPLFNAVDKIGIAAFFKLTYNLAQNQTTTAKVMAAWNSGIDYTFWINSAGNPTVVTNPSLAVKNIYWWYTNLHLNPDGLFTSWIPSSKEVIATQVGFPSVDCATNQPNVFYSPGSVDSGFPPLSSGTPDITAQMLAIDATQAFWSNLHTLDILNVYKKLFADMYWYEYDIRGDYSASPSAFADAPYYQYSHCLRPDSMAQYTAT